jgi:hypothetical protein
VHRATRPAWSSSSTRRAMAGAAVAGDPDHLALDASVQLAAAPVLVQEGVQVGEQGHEGRAYRTGPARAGGAGKSPLSASSCLERD